MACFAMPADDPDSDRVLERSLKALQENVRRSGSAASASYTLIGALVVLGGLGYGLDWWKGTSPWGVLGGLILGLIVGFYDLAKTVWQPKGPGE
jgi:F0F1-type ATP synthase assembly protein I